ncbi:hypothetical protein EDE11_101344 [Methylomonas methanica]|uniref:Uncharacterized protein n=1 Tax=Methylomonas methanica TaxID=421 RepID=A0ABY2CW85_METMH|nr:hypothetical protein EDE11_101344 [Methylomonas methanica]
MCLGIYNVPFRVLSASGDSALKQSIYRSFSFCNRSQSALMIMTLASSGAISVPQAASNSLSGLCNPNAFRIATPRQKWNSISSFSSTLATDWRSVLFMTSISRSTASSTLRGGCNISRLSADQISVKLTFLVAWRLLRLCCHGFVTGFSTEFVDNAECRFELLGNRPTRVIDYLHEEL